MGLSKDNKPWNIKFLGKIYPNTMLAKILEMLNKEKVSLDQIKKPLLGYEGKAIESITIKYKE